MEWMRREGLGTRVSNQGSGVQVRSTLHREGRPEPAGLRFRDEKVQDGA